MQADFAILMEPSNAEVEAGCQGTLRVEVRSVGERAHSARSWMGVNAIHRAFPILERLRLYEPRKPVIDGLEYHEGLNAVSIRGGVAGNVLPDECVVEVNHRFAPDRSEEEAQAFVREIFEGYEVTVLDSAPGALPGLDLPAAKAFIEAVGREVNPKFGWTDVARFTELGIPAVNFGPGDPMLAHKQEELVPVEHLTRCEQQLTEWLTDSRGSANQPAWSSITPDMTTLTKTLALGLGASALTLLPPSTALAAGTCQGLPATIEASSGDVDRDRWERRHRRLRDREVPWTPETGTTGVPGGHRQAPGRNRQIMWPRTRATTYVDAVGGRSQTRARGSVLARTRSPEARSRTTSRSAPRALRWRNRATPARTTSRPGPERTP